MNQTIEAGSNRSNASVHGIDLDSENVGDLESGHAFDGREHEDLSLLLVQSIEELSHFIRCLCPMQVAVFGGMRVRIGDEFEPSARSVRTPAVLTRHSTSDSIEPVSDRAARVEIR